jgi:hypothetical protein
MGLKQLLIILMLFGTGSSIYSLVNAGIMLTCTFLNMLFRRFWNKEKTVIFGILFTGFLSSLILELGQAINYKWATDNKLFIYSLAIIPIVLLEYSEYNFKVLIRELMLYIDSFIFVVPARQHNYFVMMFLLLIGKDLAYRENEILLKIFS